MSIRYEWVEAQNAFPTLARCGQMADGQPVAEEDYDTYNDEMVTHEYALVLGDGNPLVIEGSHEELHALLTRCLSLLTHARRKDQQ